jgi:ribosome-associated heat shock protein Hsp15
MAAQVEVRLDKWLWAARFFRTRNLAKEAIEGGKVHYNGARCKVSKCVEVGATLRIRQGFDEKIVVVKAVSDQRKGAPEAQVLYEETLESITAREKSANDRRLSRDLIQAPAMRPNKRERRQLQRLHDRNASDSWDDE